MADDAPENNDDPVAEERAKLAAQWAETWGDPDDPRTRARIADTIAALEEGTATAPAPGLFEGPADIDHIVQVVLTDALPTQVALNVVLGIVRGGQRSAIRMADQMTASIDPTTATACVRIVHVASDGTIQYSLVGGPLRFAAMTHAEFQAKYPTPSPDHKDVNDAARGND